jgi:hypothetical protein
MGRVMEYLTTIIVKIYNIFNNNNVENIPLVLSINNDIATIETKY